MYVDDVKSYVKIRVYPENIIYNTTFIDKLDGKTRDYVVKIFDDCENKTYTFHLAPKTKLPENNEVSSVEVEKNDSFVIYYVFFGASIVMLILSIYMQ